MLPIYVALKVFKALLESVVLRVIKASKVSLEQMVRTVETVRLEHKVLKD